MTSHVMMTLSKFSNVFSLYLEYLKMAELYQLVVWELQNKAINELRRVFGVV